MEIKIILCKSQENKQKRPVFECFLEILIFNTKKNSFENCGFLFILKVSFILIGFFLENTFHRFWKFQICINSDYCNHKLLLFDNVVHNIRIFAGFFLWFFDKTFLTVKTSFLCKCGANIFDN
jgi:hypothetical protein